MAKPNWGGGVWHEDPFPEDGATPNTEKKSKAIAAASTIAGKATELGHKRPIVFTAVTVGGIVGGIMLLNQIFGTDGAAEAFQVASAAGAGGADVPPLDVDPKLLVPPPYSEIGVEPPWRAEAAETAAAGAATPEAVAQYTLNDGDGITQAVAKLKANWPAGVEMPEWLKKLDTNSPQAMAEWAREHNFYTPGEVKDSVVMQKGEILGVDKSGNLVLQNTNGTTEVVADSAGLTSPDTFSNRDFSDTRPTAPTGPEKVDTVTPSPEISDEDRRQLRENIDTAFGKEIIFNDQVVYGPGAEGLSKALTSLGDPTVADIMSGKTAAAWPVGSPEREAAERIENFITNNKELFGDQSQNPELAREFFKKLGIPV